MDTLVVSFIPGRFNRWLGERCLFSHQALWKFIKKGQMGGVLEIKKRSLKFGF